MSKKNGQVFTVEMRPLARVKPYPKNAKTHSEEAVAKLAAIIDRFGFLVPIVVDAKGVILKGHRTRRAAELLGVKNVPVHVARGLSVAEAKAWRLADNRVGQDSAWDDALLRGDLGELKSEGFDLTLTGFEPAELSRYLEEPSEPPSAKGSDTDQWICVVTCRGEEELAALYEELDGRGFACKMVT